MALRFVVQPSRAFKSVCKGKLPSNLCKQIVSCSAHTQIVQEIPVKSFDEMPLIGTLFDYTKDLGGGVRGYQRMHEIQQKRVQQYGSIYREKMFDRQTVTISNPDDVEYLFRNEGKWPRREPPFPLWNKYKQDRDLVHGVNFL